MNLPTIIQGGMGVGVSDWRLANAVTRAGQLGVVSGTGVSSVLVRRLQEGDPDGAMRRALARFPAPAVAGRILEAYFIPGGKPADQPYRVVPMYTERPSDELQLLTVAANFAEVWLAREGHQGCVGINLMEKIQLPNLASLYGAIACATIRSRSSTTAPCAAPPRPPRSSGRRCRRPACGRRGCSGSASPASRHPRPTNSPNTRPT